MSQYFSRIAARTGIVPIKASAVKASAIGRNTNPQISENRLGIHEVIDTPLTNHSPDSLHRNIESPYVDRHATSTHFEPDLKVNESVNMDTGKLDTKEPGLDKSLIDRAQIPVASIHKKYNSVAKPIEAEQADQFTIEDKTQNSVYSDRPLVTKQAIETNDIPAPKENRELIAATRVPVFAPPLTHTDIGGSDKQAVNNYFETVVKQKSVYSQPSYTQNTVHTSITNNKPTLNNRNIQVHIGSIALEVFQEPSVSQPLEQIPVQQHQSNSSNNPTNGNNLSRYYLRGWG